MSNCNRTPNLCVFRGASYSEVWRYGVQPLVYKTVSAVPSLTPLTLTVTGHGLPAGWAVALTDLGGLCDVNAENWPPDSDDFYDATVLDANTIALNDVDGARLGTYTSGGTIGYYTPVNLAGASAQMLVYAYPPATTSPAAVLTKTATLDNTAKTITATLSATDTATLTGTEYSYALVFTDASSNVTVLEQGTITPQTMGVNP